MLYWLLAYTLLVDKKTNPARSRVLLINLLISGAFVVDFLLLPNHMLISIEICSVANGATKKEIGRAKEYIVKQLGLETGQSVEMGTIHAGDFMVRFLVKMSHLIKTLIMDDAFISSDIKLFFS